MCKKTGCCGSLARIFLVVINIIFFLIGAAMFVVAAVLKWSDIFKKVIKAIADDLKSELPDVQKIIDISSTILLVISAIIIFVSIVGLIGSCGANRFFLIIYNIFMSVFFGVHLVGFIYSIVTMGKLENMLKTDVRSLIDKINNEDSFYCGAYKSLSNVLECCDFDNNSKLKSCCGSSFYKQNCLESYSENIIKYLNIVYIVPNVIMLVLELLMIVSIIVIVKNVNNYNKKKRQNGPYVKSSYDMPVIVTTVQK
jgi:hypothetical protein